jgi:DamX protein
MTTDPVPAIRLDATTLARLRLDRDPFAQEACGFIFSDAAHRTQTNIASQMLQHSDRLLLVRGEPGVGKSTFLAGLARRRVPGLALCHIHAEPALALPTLCGRLLEGLGEELPADFDIEGGAFLDRVWELTARGRRPVLLLDDAEQLSPAVLRQLVACWRKGVADGSPFGLVLAGEPRLDEQMAALGVKVPVHVINLYPFSERQTLDYLTQCLQAAGNDGTLLSQAERRQIHIRSQGFAAAINAQAQHLLAAKGSVGKAVGRRPPLLLALGAVAAILAAVAVALPQWKASPQAEQPAVQVAGDAPYGLPMPDRYGFRAPGHADADAEPAQEQDVPSLRATSQENAGTSPIERTQVPQAREASRTEEDPEAADMADSSAPLEIDEDGMEEPAAPAPEPAEP